jgi:phosphotransferase system  glucose/maltose/N-acetylglucosamine-specific IIC component
MDGIFIPIIGVICIAAMFMTFSVLNARNQREVQKTLRTALERGTPLTAELVAQMNTNRPSPKTDLKRGIIIMSIGVAAVFAGVISGAFTEFATVATFPFFMGLGFLIVWKLDQSDRPSA